MRGKKASEPFEKITCRVFARDMDLIRQFFPHVGYNEVFRVLIRKTVNSLERKRLSLNEVPDVAEELQEELGE